LRYFSILLIQAFPKDNQCFKTTTTIPAYGQQSLPGKKLNFTGITVNAGPSLEACVYQKKVLAL